MEDSSMLKKNPLIDYEQGTQSTSKSTNNRKAAFITASSQALRATTLALATSCLATPTLSSKSGNENLGLR